MGLLDSSLAFSGKSQVIPVSVKKDGFLSKYSRVAGREDFQIIRSFTEGKVQEIGREILKGNTEARPYRMDKKTACDFCPYRGFCGFDERLPGFSYRRIAQRTEEEIFRKMREEAD